MTMLTLVLASAALVLGIVIGVATAWWWSRRRAGGFASPKDSVLDPDLEHRIVTASTEWATRHGQPAAAGLVANKLRLLAALHQRREDGREKS
jgi:hypothetical protein